MKKYILTVVVFLMIFQSELRSQSKEIVKLKMINFSPYTKVGQNPNYRSVISEQQISSLLDSIVPYTEGIRTFGTLDGLDRIPYLAKQRNLKVILGIWLGRDTIINNQQIESGIKIAKDGMADRFIVGSEVLLRNELSADQIIRYIKKVKIACPGIPVSCADITSKLIENPEIVDVCDFVSYNCYPFWERIPIDCAIKSFHQSYLAIKRVAKGKEIFISESGWKTEGEALGDAVPSLENAIRYDLDLLKWSKANNIEVNLFCAFNEPWKLPYDDGWGIFKSDATLKPGMDKLFTPFDKIDSTWNSTKLNQAGADTLTIDFLPSIGNTTDLLKGSVNHINPDDYIVGSYIKVADGWWIKPTYAQPTVPILCNGEFNLNICTGGMDWSATEIFIYLAPIGYIPPSCGGCSVLPTYVLKNAIVKKWITRCPLPGSTITKSQDSILFGESTVLTANGGTSYLWNTGEVSESIQVSPTKSTDYYVTYTTDSGCTETDKTTVTIVKAYQTITFANLPNVDSENLPFELTAWSNSGLPINYISTNNSVASILGNTLTINGPGKTFITAFQEGNAKYYPAFPVSQEFSVSLNTGIPKLSEKEIKIFPNPSDGIFTLQLDNDYQGEINLKILAVIGSYSKFLKVYKTSKNMLYQLDLNDLPKGMYILDIETTKEKVEKKILVN